MIRWSLSQALSQEGYDVISVEDGKKAVEKTKTQHFDFIITDLVMPGLDGWEVLEIARQADPPARVIIITGAHGREDMQTMAKERGAWAYLEKPYIIDNIKNLLKEAP